MAVCLDLIQPGAVFRFQTAPRRVISISKAGAGQKVNWEYADGKMHGGRLKGSTWLNYFQADAIEQIPDPASAPEMRRLRASDRAVSCLPEVTTISLNTRCPGKWALVDLETGEMWGHDGTEFHPLAPEVVDEVATVARKVAGARR